MGLEIKRDTGGRVVQFPAGALPIVAACGGMLVPVLIYYFMTAGTPAQSGLAIPMATDIAFSLGVLQPVRQAGSAELESLSDRFRCGR